jgi:hypothetical protein
VKLEQIGIVPVSRQSEEAVVSLDPLDKALRGSDRSEMASWVPIVSLSERAR